MLGSGERGARAWTRCAIVVVLMLLTPGEARAAPPQADPLNPPAISVTAHGAWAYGRQHPADGDTLAVSPGTWSGLGNTYAYQWQRCASTAPSSCADLPGHEAQTIVPSGLFGAHLRVAVTATNAQGSTTAYSAMTAALADEVPHRVDPSDGPVLAGLPKEGERLTIDGLRKYAGSPPLVYHGYSSPWMVWRRYGDGSTDAHTVIDNPSSSYVLQASDVGKYIAVTFTVRNGAGHTTGDYTIFDRIGPIQPNTDPPASESAPGIEAAAGAVDGAALQGSPGRWTGAGPLSYAYQWLRCDAEGEGCADASGETTSRYRAVAADVGARLRLRVTATNRYGTGVATSPPTAPIAAAPPVSTSAPSVAGLARDGQVLAGSAGTFSGTAPIEHSFAWERCDALGHACDSIAGATSASYALTPQDIGHRLRYRQTATNAGGSASSRSAATALVEAIAPAVSELPAIAGLARDEEKLTGTRGLWAGSPTISYAFQWMRCAETAATDGCNAISGATGEGYTTVSADVGSFLRLRVTASNQGHATEALSRATGAIAAVAPRPTSGPSVSGDAVDGATLTVSRGAWAGTAPQTYAQRWERCGDVCAVIEGATAPAYRLSGPDVGQRVRAVVIASGPGGTTERATTMSDLVAAVAPAATAAPGISGTARDGSTLTATEGAWRGSAPIARELRWERCGPDGDGCASIAGAVGPSLELSAADVGRRVRVTERASNAGGEAFASSQPSAVVAAVAPSSTALPRIAGTARDGETLTATNGEWAGSPEITYTRQWLRCAGSDDAGGCEPIPSGSGLSHRLTGEDVGSFLRVRVTAVNPAGTTVAWSAPAGGAAVVASPPSGLAGAGPVAVIHPPEGGRDPDQSAPDVGDRVIVDPGSWSGTDRPGHRIAFGYAWERCTASGCVSVPGRDAAETVVTAEDVDAQLRAVVTASSAAGSQAQATPRLGAARGAFAAAPPALAVAPPASLALPAGSLLTPGNCQRVARRTLTARAGAAGRVRLTVPAGTSSLTRPLALKVSVARPRALKKLTVKVGGKRIRLRRGRSGVLLPRHLAASPQLLLVAVPRSGRPVKVTGRLRASECDALLTVGLRGARLSLRVDQRAPIERVTFTLPKGLALKLAQGRFGTVEALRFGVPGKHVAPALAGGGVELAGRKVTLSALPAGSATVTLSTTLVGKRHPRGALRFGASTGGGVLTTTLSLRHR